MFAPMARTREIKKRITAVRTIERITKTMQMIATAKFTSALHSAKRTQPYAEKVRQLVGEVSAAAGDIEHPLINGPAEPVKRELLLVITSDRGLCGAYNGNILRAAMSHVRKVRAAGSEIVLQTAGKKAVGYFKFQRVPITERYTFGDKIDYAQVERLAEKYINAFSGGEFDAVRVASMKFISNSRQTPQVLQLLPLKPAEADAADEAAASAVYEFSPSAEALLDDLLPLTVKTMLFQAFNEAVVSEQIMRMIAMKAATENAKEIGKLLKRKFNRARQSQITTELMEVISGAAALG